MNIDVHIRYRGLYTFHPGAYLFLKSIRKYRFFGHPHVTGIENLYIFHSSQVLLPKHFAAVGPESNFSRAGIS